jgi:hypothetical protein
VALSLLPSSHAERVFQKKKVKIASFSPGVLCLGVVGRLFPRIHWIWSAPSLPASIPPFQGALLLFRQALIIQWLTVMLDPDF